MESSSGSPVSVDRDSMSVIVRNLHRIGIAPAPFKANPVPVVDPDAVLTVPVATELFQAVPGRDFQIVE